VLGCNYRTVERSLQDALDELSRILLADGLMKELALCGGGGKSCQEGKNYKIDVSRSKEGKNKYRKVVGVPPPNLIS